MGLWGGSDRDILILVDLSSGHFAYASTVVLFVSDEDSIGPEHQLELVLDLAKRKRRSGEKHPLANLDYLYSALILKRLSPTKLQLIQRLLLIHRLYLDYVKGPGSLSSSASITSANVLRLSEQQLRDVCKSLHAVMVLDVALNFKFYHASFMDFLQDSSRSQEYSIWSPSTALTSLDNILQTLNEIQVSYDDAGE
jgi:hypothetical protein